MSSNNSSGSGEVLLIFTIVLAIFLFLGEPDVHDLIIQYLQKIAAK